MRRVCQSRRCYVAGCRSPDGLESVAPVKRNDLDRRLGDLLDDVPPHDDRARRQTLLALDATPQQRWRWRLSLGEWRSERLAPAAQMLVLGLVLAGLVGLIARPTVTPADPGGSDSSVVAQELSGRFALLADLRSNRDDQGT